MRHAIVLLAALCLVSACECPFGRGGKDLTEYVNPFIGCSATGHTFPAACVPFGHVAAGPDTGNFSWDYCSGYRYADPDIQMFSQTHLNGTGAIDLGDVGLMPFVGAKPGPSPYRKETQRAKPGYYAVTLDRFGVDAEATAAPHVALYRFTYRKDAPARLLLDLQYGLVGDKNALSHHVLENDTTVESRTVVSGFNRTHFWVDRDIYFVVTFDRPYAAISQLPRQPGEKAPRFVLDFDLKPGEALQAKVAIATSDLDGARRNLAAELPGWDFDATRSAARGEWNKLLSRAEILEGTPDQKTTFYTSLYHLFIQPNNIADVDGRYRGADNKLAVAPGKAYYSTLSLWDTFRAAHPLYTILAPERVDGFVQTMLAHQKAFGSVPIITQWGKESYAMIGTHSVPVIVDAYFKGFKGFDPNAAMDAIKASLDTNHPGFPKDRWDLLDKYGYYPFDIITGESVSRTLECSYDDWCAAKLAAALGRKDDAAFFGKRAMNYKNVFDPSVGFMRGKDSNGKWREPFSAFSLGHGAELAHDFTEGNSWQYTWHVLQDPEGLIALLGGKDAFADKLDGLFKQKSTVEGMGTLVDVTGLIGQYAHGNEPSHHTVYFFDFAGRPWRTQELVREVCDKFYLNKPDGLCGNDDCGQMSAWYVFSALGFYPFNPCASGYVFGAPQIGKARLSLPGGKRFTITAENLSAANKYVQGITLNGKPVTGFTLSHEAVMAGGDLVFTMGPAPKK
jgi:predicted alpha-1,2-mannosidase